MAPYCSDSEFSRFCGKICDNFGISINEFIHFVSREMCFHFLLTDIQVYIFFVIIMLYNNFETKWQIITEQFPSDRRQGYISSLVIENLNKLLLAYFWTWFKFQLWMTDSRFRRKDWFWSLNHTQRQKWSKKRINSFEIRTRTSWTTASSRGECGGAPDHSSIRLRYC